MLDFRAETLAEAKLLYIEPEQWKNVGISLIQCMNVMKESHMETSDRLKKLKAFLDKFIFRVIDGLKYNKNLIDQTN